MAKPEELTCSTCGITFTGYKPKVDKPTLCVDCRRIEREEKFSQTKVVEGILEPQVEDEVLPIADEATDEFKSYAVTVVPKSLNVRRGPGCNQQIVKVVASGEGLTIIEESDGLVVDATLGKWGRLESKIGWVNLAYVKRV